MMVYAHDRVGLLLCLCVPGSLPREPPGQQGEEEMQASG